MEARDVTYFGPKARPIFIERDYDAAKRLLSLHAQTLKPFLEAGRFQSLIRELSDYERRSGNTPAAVAEPVAAFEAAGRQTGSTPPVVRRRPLGRSDLVRLAKVHNAVTIRPPRDFAPTPTGPAARQPLSFAEDRSTY